MNLPEIAVLDANILSLMGMKALLLRIVPQAEICTFQTFQQMEEHGTETFVHYFASARMLMQHGAFFSQHRTRTVVMVAGGTPPPSGFHLLDVTQDEETLVRSMLRLMSHAHAGGRHLPPAPQQETGQLSGREAEVLALIARGHLNKEIAAMLHISITTVISHRKNIMEKLRIRSVSGLTIYAVMNGLVDMGLDS